MIGTKFAFAESLRPVYSLWLKNIILIYLKHILSEMIFAMNKNKNAGCKFLITKKGLKSDKTYS